MISKLSWVKRGPDREDQFKWETPGEDHVMNTLRRRVNFFLSALISITLVSIHAVMENPFEGRLDYSTWVSFSNTLEIKEQYKDQLQIQDYKGRQGKIEEDKGRREKIEEDLQKRHANFVEKSGHQHERNEIKDERNEIKDEYISSDYSLEMIKTFILIIFTDLSGGKQEMMMTIKMMEELETRLHNSTQLNKIEHMMLSASLVSFLFLWVLFFISV